MPIEQIAGDILQAVGGTPLVRLGRMARGLKAEILLKVEGMNPGGSIKDRAALRMVETAERRGLLRPGGTIIEATAGNTGVGLALVAAVRGYRCIFVLPDKMSSEKVALLRAYGAEVVITPTAVAPDSPESYNGVAERLTREIEGAYRPAQFENEENPEAHYASTGPEIWAQVGGRLDVLVAGMGTGGTISGTGRFLKEKDPDIRVIGADPEGSILSGDSPKPWKVEGIGEDFVPRTFDRQVVDEMIRIGDREAFAVARRLAREEGVLAGGSSGTALAAALRYAQRATRPLRIVVILPDTGRNYITKFYSDDWLTTNGLWEGERGASLTVGEAAARRRKAPGLVSVGPDEHLEEAFRKMDEFGISQVPVIENGESVGNVAEAGLMRLVFDGVDFSAQRVRGVMGRPLPGLDVDTDLSEAYRLLLAGNSAILVLKGGKPVQVLSRFDLLDFRRKGE
jgi:cystathionine beta-synthase